MSGMPEAAYPYGLRNVVLFPITNLTSTPETYGAAVPLPASRTLSYEDAEDFSELRGNDTVVAERGNGASIEWDLEGGGISLEAYAILAGGEVVEGGVTPSRTKTYSKGRHSRPYFKVEGQAIADNLGDVHIVLPKCRCTGNVGGEFADGGWFLTSGSGRAYLTNGGDLIEIIHNEAETDINVTP